MKKIRSLFIKILLIGLPGHAFLLNAQDARINFNFKNKALEEVISSLIEAYNIPIAYQDQQIRGITVTAQCENCTQEQAIQTILQSTPISAYQLQAQIILSKDKTKQTNRERNRIIGRIIDARNNTSLPMPTFWLRNIKRAQVPVRKGNLSWKICLRNPLYLKCSISAIVSKSSW